MIYGCIGERLSHSFSKEIHRLISDYDYEIREVEREGLDEFMRNRDFLAINVTIPYKEAVIPYLSKIDNEASLIGSVNTIVNREGKLYGYNTDFYGMSMLAKRIGISFSNKKVLILGTGGTSKTAKAVAKAEGASEIILVSRNKSESTVSYSDVYARHTDADIIINTTPVGMFPDIFKKPIELAPFKNLKGVIDAIYNPQKTPLVLEAEALRIPAAGGLYMLVAQGVRASEIFQGKKYPEELLDEVFEKIVLEKTNVVLIGMPASGKTTVGKILSEKLGRSLFDTDKIIENTTKCKIPEIFENDGEEAFRDIECETVTEVSKHSSAVIATGGGVPLREKNVSALRENGRIYFIDRSPELLLPTEDRPTASTKDAIKKRYNERIDIYKASADVIIDGCGTPTEVAEAILTDFFANGDKL